MRNYFETKYSIQQFKVKTGYYKPAGDNMWFFIIIFINITLINAFFKTTIAVLKRRLFTILQNVQ